MISDTSPTLYRIAAVAGIGSGIVLLVNAAKRSELIPLTAGTQLVAPLAQIFALALVVGLYFAFGRRTGIFGLVAFLVNAGALAALVGVEFVINLVFATIPVEMIAELRAGPLGLALTVVSVLFLIGTLAFTSSLAITRQVPIAPLALYAIGAIPVALRSFVPELVLNVGLAVMAGGILWLSVWLLIRVRAAAPAQDYASSAGLSSRRSQA